MRLCRVKQMVTRYEACRADVRALKKRNIKKR
jgi:hypothetical protein